MRSSATTRGRVLRAQRLELRDLAGLEQLADLLGRALADALDLLQLLDGELAEVGRLRGDRLRRALVGAHAERLRVALVEDRQLGELAQHVEHVLLRVGHGHVVPRRTGTTRAAQLESQFADSEAQTSPARSVCGCVRRARLRPPCRRALTRPGWMAPMSDATADRGGGPHVRRRRHGRGVGMGEDSVIAVELGITNAGREPDKVSAGSMWCWLELAADPGRDAVADARGRRRRRLPQGVDLDDLKLGSVRIPAGATRSLWVVFRGYRFAGSDAPRKVTVSLPDARGRRVQLVIADPARGELRWEMAPARTGTTYGMQNTAVIGAGVHQKRDGGEAVAGRRGRDRSCGTSA